MLEQVSARGRGAALARRLAAGALDALLPPRCLACAAPVDAPHRLCGRCWAEADFIVPPLCAVCGLPFDIDPGEEALCGSCAALRPDFDRARAALRYGGVARTLALRFKHADRTDLAPALSRWMVGAGRALLTEADVIAPVPLHRLRLFARRYNQAAVLAAAVARLSERPFAPDLLRRTRRTPSQAGLSRSARIRNQRGAFAVRSRYAGRIRGARVVLIDDVMTTGATAGACARALRRAGAARIDVLTLARVVAGAG